MSDSTTVVGISRSDLRLIDVLQDAPRAAWAEVARRLGVSAPTVRRRWHRMTEAGLAWITTYPDPIGGIAAGLVEVQCRPGTASDVARNLLRHPKVLSIASMTGDTDLLLTVYASSSREFRKIVQQDLGGGGDIVRVRSRLATRLFTDGSDWRADAYSKAHPDPAARELSGPSREQLLTMLEVLERDGRAPAEHLARALGTTDTHARRLVARATASGHLMQRVDVSNQHTRWPHGLVLWMVVPAARLNETARHISSLPPTRSCAALAGGQSNLYASVWLRSLHEAAAIEAEIVRSLDVHVVDRGILMHYHKRIGHVFDDDRNRIGHVSWVGTEPRDPVPVAPVTDHD